MFFYGLVFFAGPNHFDVVDKHLLKFRLATFEINFEFDVVLDEVIAVTAHAMPMVFAHRWPL
jgi:hypothetical protein